ncbi:MAG: KpsF/GutQ family sugar-phosphate isomerase [Planctomycetes bacterium]|nr:KpsF/GutQ family sugar-phosphate isomerase [Planctomycetota bacterium]
MTLAYGKEVLDAEVAAINSVRDHLGAAFEEALALIAEESGRRVIACGIGKAGIIAQKVAATLASTGTDAVFMHPADALHGDLGMVRKHDVALIFSNSGESDEISRLLPFLRSLGLKLIAVTSSTRSTLGVQADIVLEMGDLQEACPLGLAPTASTTAMLALGDALAMSLMKQRGFSNSDFAAIHPGGNLGKKVFTVAEVIRGKNAVALVKADTQVREVLQRISSARAGSAVVIDHNGELLGIFTDGDLRRGLLADAKLLAQEVGKVMTRTPYTINAAAAATEALAVMQKHRIGEMPVLDQDNKVCGMVDIKGLLAAGFTSGK